MEEQALRNSQHLILNENVQVPVKSHPINNDYAAQATQNELEGK